MRISWRAFPVVVVVLSSCVAEGNAVLDVRMRIPREAPFEYAFVKVSEADEFDAVWGSILAQRFELVEPTVETEGCNLRFSVEAPRPRSERRALETIRIKMWFCDAAEPRECSEPTSLEEGWLIELPQPFYEGERTEWYFAPNVVDPSTMQRPPGDCGALTSAAAFGTRSLAEPAHFSGLDRCDIKGCINEGAFAEASRGFCVDASREAHLCER